MYSQGSYNSHQQRPPGLPPPPPPHFQQVPLSAVPPPHIVQPGPPIYQHGPPLPPPPANKSYFHGSTSLPHMYPTAQQNSQYPAHLGIQNVHHIPQSVPPPPPPTPPSRVLPPPPPPPPSQGQTLYRAPVLPPPPPPPPTSSFLTSSQYGTFVQSTSGNSHLPPLAPLPPPPPPPPPPSSPPPVPPSPPPTSSTPLLNASYMSGRANSATNSNKVSGSKLRTLDRVDIAVAVTQDGHNAPVRDGGTSDSPLRPLGIESSKQPYHMMAAGGSYSPVDSDMEMEGQSN